MSGVAARLAGISAAHATGGTEELDVDPLATAIVNAVITNVGGAGYYDDVVDMIDGENMECPSYDGACVKEVWAPKKDSGCSIFLQSVIPGTLTVVGCALPGVDDTSKCHVCNKYPWLKRGGKGMPSSSPIGDRHPNLSPCVRDAKCYLYKNVLFCVA